MKRDFSDFIAERAEHLAIVYLTRSQNLAIERLKEADHGLGLLVTILQDNLPIGRIFGIQIKGRDQAFENIQQQASFALLEREKTYLQDLPFPVCLFVFTMEDDKGYYKWLKYSSGLNTNIHPLEHNQWRSLDEYQVNQILEEVNAWYDAKRHSAA